MPSARLLQRIPAIIGGISTQATPVRFPEQLQDAENVVFSLKEGAKRRAGSVAVSALSEAGIKDEEQYKLHTIERDEQEQYLVVYGRGVLSVLDVRSSPPRWASVVYKSPAAKSYIERNSPRAEEIRMTTIADTTIIANATVKTRVKPDTDGAEIDGTRMPVKMVRTSVDPLVFEVDLIEWGGRSYNTQVIVPIATPYEDNFYRLGYLSTNPPPDPNLVQRELTQNISVNAKASQDAPISPAERGGIEQYIAGNGRSADDYIDSGNPSNNRPWKAIVGLKAFPFGKVICTGGPLRQGKKVYIRISPDISMSELLTIEHPDGWAPPTDPQPVVPSAKSQLKITRGDDETNPAPELIRLELPITEIGYHRNRLIIASDEHIAMSRTDDIFNFYAEDDANIVDSDPIDVSLAANDVCVVDHVLPYRDTMLITTKVGQQFELIATDVLGPNSVAIVPTTRYSTQPARPLQFRDRVFVAGAGEDSSLVYEYFYSDTTQSSTAADITKHVHGLIPPRLLRMAGHPNTDSIYSLAVPRGLPSSFKTVPSGSLFWGEGVSWVGEGVPRPWDDITIVGDADVAAVGADRLDAKWSASRTPFVGSESLNLVTTPTGLSGPGGFCGCPLAANQYHPDCYIPGAFPPVDQREPVCGNPSVLKVQKYWCGNAGSQAGVWPPAPVSEAQVAACAAVAAACGEGFPAVGGCVTADMVNCGSACSRALRECYKHVCGCEDVCDMPCMGVLIPANYDGYPWTAAGQTPNPAPPSDFPQFHFDAWGNRRAGPPALAGEPQPEIIPPKTVNGVPNLHILYHTVKRGLITEDTCVLGRKGVACTVYEEHCTDLDGICAANCPDHPFPDTCTRSKPGTWLKIVPDWLELVNPYENTSNGCGPACPTCCLTPSGSCDNGNNPAFCPSLRGTGCDAPNAGCPFVAPAGSEIHVRYFRLKNPCGANAINNGIANGTGNLASARWRCSWRREAWITTRHPAYDWPANDPPCVTGVFQYPADAFLDKEPEDPTEATLKFSDGAIYAYRQYTVGNERKQSAWSVFNFGSGDRADEIMDIATVGDNLYLIRKGPFDADKGTPWLAIEKIDIGEENKDLFSLGFIPHIDHAIASEAGEYDADAGVTRWSLHQAIPHWRDPAIDTAIIKDADGDTFEHRPPPPGGSLGLVVSEDGQFVEIPGDHTGMLAVFGRQYRSSITLSRIYMRAEQPLDDGAAKISKLIVSHTNAFAYRVLAIPRWDTPRATAFESEAMANGTLNAWIMADSRDIDIRIESTDVRAVSWTAIETHGMYGSNTAG